ncbi:unnamed protein product [Tilletia caries]|nr:unnamed protein product [Tilletia caries]
MLAAQKFLAIAFAGVGKHQYSQACLDDIWAHKVLPADTWRTLAAARLINRFGARESFIGADLYQEHLNKELQRTDTTHGAATVVARLRDSFSAVCEISRSLHGAHAYLFDENGNLERESKFVKDIERISNLAQQDRLLDARQDRLSDATLAQRAAQRPKENAAGVPSGIDLLADLVSAKCGDDALERGLWYLRARGLRRWTKVRKAWDRFDGLPSSDDDKDHQNETSFDPSKDVEMKSLDDMEDDPDVFSDGDIQSSERDHRHQAWLRREEEEELEWALAEEELMADEE